MPGVSRRFGKTAELMCWTGPAGIPAQNQRLSGEILPNSYDLEQIGEPGTQDMSFGAEDGPFWEENLNLGAKMQGLEGLTCRRTG